MFFTKVVKANIIAFIKAKILRHVLSMKNPPFQKCQPLLHSALIYVERQLQNIQISIILINAREFSSMNVHDMLLCPFPQKKNVIEEKEEKRKLKI